MQYTLEIVWMYNVSEKKFSENCTMSRNEITADSLPFTVERKYTNPSLERATTGYSGCKLSRSESLIYYAMSAF